MTAASVEGTVGQLRKDRLDDSPAEFLLWLVRIRGQGCAGAGTGGSELEDRPEWSLRPDGDDRERVVVAP